MSVPERLQEDTPSDLLYRWGVGVGVWTVGRIGDGQQGTGWDLTILVSWPFVISWSARQPISSSCRVERFIHLLFSLYLGLFGYFSPLFRPPTLALGGVQLPLSVLQWYERTERT